MTEKLRAEAIEPLLQLAATSTDPEIRTAALDAIVRFPLSTDAWKAVAGVVMTLIREEPFKSAIRKAAIQLAAQIPLITLRELLRDMASDSNEEDRAVVETALEEVGDISRVQALLERARHDRGESFERLALMPLELCDLTAEDIPSLVADPTPNASLWRALALARLGDLEELDEFVHSNQYVPELFWGSPWSAYAALAGMRPVPQPLHDYCLDLLKGLEDPAVSEQLDPDRHHLLRLMAWAITGEADAEGTPLPEKKQELDDVMRAPPEPEKPLVSVRTEVPDTKIFSQRLFSHEISEDEIGQLDRLPSADLGNLIRETVEEGNRQASRLEEDVPASIVLGNSIVSVIPQDADTDAWPITELTLDQIGSARPALDNGQLGWVLSRARPERVVGDLTKLLDSPLPKPDSLQVIELIGAAADNYSGASGSPYRGAGPGGTPFTVGRGELIDDRIMAMAPAPVWEEDKRTDAFDDFDLMQGAAPASPAEEEIRPEEKRHVTLDLYEVDHDRDRKKVRDHLLVETQYEVELRIAEHHKGTVSAIEAIDSKDLPAGDNNLDVHFVPLVRDISGAVQPSQHQPLVLPEIADSNACVFAFTVPAGIVLYRARFIVSHRNRVLQTLILSAPVGETNAEFLLEVENIFDPSFSHLPDRPSYDAALLINDSPSGVPGIIAMQGNSAYFSELEELNKMTSELRDYIFKKSAYPGPMGRYNSKKMTDFLYTLSSVGKDLWDTLPQSVKSVLEKTTRRIQIVDVKVGSYFPAEFVYRGDAPERAAKLCPNGAKALQCSQEQQNPAAISHDTCVHRDDPNYICPLRMWGFNLVIERQPASGGPQQGYLVSDITHTVRAHKKDVLQRVVVSFSEKVSQADRNAGKNLIKALSKYAGNVHFVKNWTELKKTVAKESPTLIILLPHSDVEADIPGQPPTLELGGEILSRRYLKPDHILGPESAEPVVMLLGCDTNMAEIPFLNFIKRFKDCGATMVMGTITQIDALRTVNFVKRFLEAIHTSADTSPSFGELLLETRRNLLAAGDGYALSLLAYGDSD